MFNILKGFLSGLFASDVFPNNGEFRILGMQCLGCLHYRVPGVYNPQTGDNIYIGLENVRRDVITILFQGMLSEPYRVETCFTWLTMQTLVITCYKQMFARAQNSNYPQIYPEKLKYDSVPPLQQLRGLCPCPLPYPACCGAVDFLKNDVCDYY
jgi:hypothetical protein